MIIATTKRFIFVLCWILFFPYSFVKWKRLKTKESKHKNFIYYILTIKRLSTPKGTCKRKKSVINKIKLATFQIMKLVHKCTLKKRLHVRCNAPRNLKTYLCQCLKLGTNIYLFPQLFVLNIKDCHFLFYTMIQNY